MISLDEDFIYANAWTKAEAGQSEDKVTSRGISTVHHVSS